MVKPNGSDLMRQYDLNTANSGYYAPGALLNGSFLQCKHMKLGGNTKLHSFQSSRLFLAVTSAFMLVNVLVLACMHAEQVT